MNSQQTGWSAESKLLQLISKELDKLGGGLSNITSGGGGNTSGGSTYTRPSDWLPLPTLVNGDEKIVMLHKVDNTDSNFCAFIVTGDYTVDWGDGSATQNFASGTMASYIFDYNASGISSQTPTSRGYRQVIVTITPQSGQSLIRLDLNVKYTPTSTGIALQQYSTGWLDISIVGSNFTRIAIGSDSVNTTTLNVVQKSLESFQYVGSVNSGFTNTAYMFHECEQLKSVVLDTSNSTNTTNMFFNCYSLENIPLLSLGSLTNATNMFGGCYSLKTVPLFDLHSLQNATSMFSSCFTLKTVPAFNLSSLTSAVNMFNGCRSLLSVPLFTLLVLTAADSMFTSCLSLANVSLINTSTVITASNMFSSSASLISIPALNLSSMTAGSGIFLGCSSLSSTSCFGMVTSFSVQASRLSKTSLESLFSRLAAVTSQTLTITGNWGADTPISKTICGTTSGSLVITQTNTSSLQIGMRVTGTGIDTAVAVSLLIGTNTITRTAHGIPNGRLVSLLTLVTTTGLNPKTPYYVVNATANDFQLSLTSGGAPIVFTGANGTGTLYYPSYITSINTNVSFTVDVPASATNSVTLSSRFLDTTVAIEKGWVVTG